MLPNARDALRGWIKKIPPNVRDPVPEEVKLGGGVAGHTERRARRSGLDVAARHLCAAVRNTTHHGQAPRDSPHGRGARRPPAILGLLFAPGDTSQRCTNFDQDDAVLVGDRRNPWVADVLAQVIRIRGHGKLFAHLSLAAYEGLVRKAAAEIEIALLYVSPHVVRHAGPSRDRLDRARSVAEIQRRGRWRCAHSMRRYEKEGKSLRQWNALTLDTRVELANVAKRFPAWLLRALRMMPAQADNGFTRDTSGIRAKGLRRGTAAEATQQG